MSKTWNRDDAIAMCQQLEAVVPACGAHVALTGGCLFKDGDRKDLDVVIYRIRQDDRIDGPKLMEALVELGFVLKIGAPSCWLMKAEHNGRKVDFLFPENEGGDYGVEIDEPPPGAEAIP